MKRPPSERRSSPAHASSERVEFAGFELAQIRVSTLPRIATGRSHGYSAASSPARRALLVPTVAPAGSCLERSAARTTPRRRADQRGAGTRRCSSPSASADGRSLRAVHRDIGAAVEQAALDVCGEPALTFELLDRGVDPAVALGANDKRLDVIAAGRASASTASAVWAARARSRASPAATVDVSAAGINGRAGTPRGSPASLPGPPRFAKSRHRPVQEFAHHAARQHLDALARLLIDLVPGAECPVDLAGPQLLGPLDERGDRRPGGVALADHHDGLLELGVDDPLDCGDRLAALVEALRDAPAELVDVDERDARHVSRRGVDIARHGHVDDAERSLRPLLLESHRGPGVEHDASALSVDAMMTST